MVTLQCANTASAIHVALYLVRVAAAEVVCSAAAVESWLLLQVAVTDTAMYARSKVFVSVHVTYKPI
jgi:hypothetical protein